tara:strand:- start:1140 stop:1622 length:483 start_codon:yes stop_codon:yes gene_type:complete
LTQELLDALATLNENMEKNNQLLRGISNLIEENPGLDKFAQELHKLSTSIGQIGKIAASEIQGKSGNTDSKGRSIVKPQWEKCDTKGDWVCRKPENAKETECKKCGKKIIWTVTKNNKKMPISECPTRPSWWVSHFDSCKPDNPSPAPAAKSDQDMDFPF